MAVEFKNVDGTVITSGLDQAKSVEYVEGTNKYILDISGASPSLKYTDSSSGSSVETDFTKIFLTALQGSKGPAGDKGQTGDKGPAGDKGDKGLAGDKGPAGTAGYPFR